MARRRGRTLRTRRSRVTACGASAYRNSQRAQKPRLQDRSCGSGSRGPAENRNLRGAMGCPPHARAAYESIANAPTAPRNISPPWADMSLALTGHIEAKSRCLLSGVKRTKSKQDALSAFDPKRTKTGSKSRSATGSRVISLGGSTRRGRQHPTDSERFRSGPRTCPPFCGSGAGSANGIKRQRPIP